MKKILITGGQASGKSSLAIRLADGVMGKRTFIATARYLDGELNEKIKAHKRERGDRYSTIEEPLNLAAAFKKALTLKSEVIVIDCITMWISNMLIEADEETISDSVNLFLSTLMEADNAPLTLITVTNECGSGVIPANELSRNYVKYLGRTNKKLAAFYDEVYFTCCGLEMRLK
ncbi:MAG TPA: bifunctional adenosylcobinamide kinase/adenosylcobinamide-phosphate guanylyltransferase [Thermotogota bacterium]|nr:bifunctional adenosylcobinamide kinase/adenosylcobinamide-phosphate guanylyltransferase [Thermotogota bacterium]HPJ87541.1 bifunctional adenosylcobinamide kinase/adenosylcobinamide-phosphate guanylyltransferase [Thermotogota bacterium]HPR94746.1 bifunctional adenosylcobinamide kinase/adenosylcobinamide-phosphate guanylyltransferase [Thermotogota bacterium]